MAGGGDGGRLPPALPAPDGPSATAWTPAGVGVIEHADAARCLDLGANYWSLWTEAENLARYHERASRRPSTALRAAASGIACGRRGSGSASATVERTSSWWPSRTTAWPACRARSTSWRRRATDGAARAAPSMRVIPTAASCGWRPSACRRASRRQRAPARGDRDQGRRRPVRWACAQPVETDGSLAVRLLAADDARLAEGESDALIAGVRCSRPGSPSPSSRRRRRCRPRRTRAAGGVHRARRSLPSGAAHHALPARSARPGLGPGRGAPRGFAQRAAPRPTCSRCARSIRPRLLDVHLGGLPEDEDAAERARSSGTIPMDGYRIEKLVFESLPGLHVTALVYVPEAPPRTQARRAASPAGTHPIGKAYPALPGDQRAARAAAGTSCICWDPVGQGERSQYWDAARGRSRYNLVCGEHAVLGQPGLRRGHEPRRATMVWDGMRAARLPAHAPGRGRRARIAITGHERRRGFQSLYSARSTSASGGGAVVLRHLAADAHGQPDLRGSRTAIPSRTLPASSPRASTIRAAAARSIRARCIVLAAVKDFFPIEGTRTDVPRGGRPLRALRPRGPDRHGARCTTAIMYSPENRRVRLRLPRPLQRGCPSGPRSIRSSALDGARPARDAHRPGARGPRRPLAAEVIREEFRARPQPQAKRTLADLYRDGAAPSRVRKARAPQRSATCASTAIACTTASTWSSLSCTSTARRRHAGAPCVVLALEGKVGAADWPAVRRRLDAGGGPVVRPARRRREPHALSGGLGRRPHPRGSGRARAYFNPLSGVLLRTTSTTRS